MLLTPILLDADMSASEVLSRLAANGFWLDSRAPAARARIQALSACLQRAFDTISASIERDPRTCGAAIRRQWGTYVLWYARSLDEILARCTQAPPGSRLIDVLGLHESDSDEASELTDLNYIPPGNLVVMDLGLPTAVSLGDNSLPSPPIGNRPFDGGPLRGGDGFPRAAAVGGLPSGAGATAAPLVAWPQIEAPEWTPALAIFEVKVGFAPTPQAGVSGGAIALPFTPDMPTLEFTIELSAGPEVEAMDGWRRIVHVSADAVDGAQASFSLVGTEPTNAERAWLTTLEVRYVLGGTVCGTASRPLVILPASSTVGPDVRPHGVAWTATPASSSPVALVADGDAPDLTLEISKPDGNAASGRYQCRLLSPHQLATPLGPFDMDLGQDARTYARELVDEIRLYTGDPLLSTALEGVGRLVAQKLPPEFFAALAEVNGHARPQPAAVLIVSSEHYVPWELAWVEAPLDAARPRFLGAQAVVGRWLRDHAAMSGAYTAAPRPAIHPLGSIEVRRMAVMAAWYKQTSGMRRLPEAEDEARALVAAYAGVPLSATSEQLRDLLEANLRVDCDAVQVQAVHFAGHGAYDPTVPDASAMYLENGKPLRSTLFRAAKYGGERQPLLFLNACMLGIGGELLGDMAGFPGNSLRGGFGGVLGALWEVDDLVAYRVAIEFWERALPPAPALGEPIGLILRDLRARYMDAEPIATYLSYVYYGHPRLRLRRAA